MNTPKTSLLDEPADIAADIGTQVWARGVAAEIRFQAKKFDTDVKSLQRWIEIAAEHEAWRTLGYISLDAFLVKAAGISQSIIDAIRNAKGGTVGDAIKAAKETPLADVGPPTIEERDNPNTVRVSQHGNATDYTLRRLARDCPEMLDRIEAGELSVNAAAIAAGIRKKATPAEVCVKAFQKVDDRLAAFRSIIASMSLDELAACRQAFDEVMR